MVADHSIDALSVMHSDLQAQPDAAAECSRVHELHHFEAEVDYSLGEIGVLF